ncbi:MAG: hypothetical protein IPJ27_13880 [Candidatus Accumulibacter sp.]|uniref:Uncharacterized protein n=1 Tax=Candidatus Accumulibacter proximus TaxID=2954385 RepID=A0A935Q1C2_9PROT|nr:hypothetical protein [Candidatus Accumulibacter proximus]
MFRLQRKIGLIPENGLGIGRRAVFWSLLAWLPIAVWAWQKEYLLPVDGGEPLLAHFGINARLLLAVPLFIFAEGMMHSTLTTLLPRLVSSGVVPPGQLDRLRSVLSDIAQLRDSVLPWIAIFAALASFFLFSRPSEVPHELSWAKDQADGAGMGLGVWWYLYVGRTIFLTLLLAWLWRLALLFMLFKRIAGLELSMVPTHPDRCAGLGFMARIPVMFVPVVLGISSVFASGWAHQVVYHDVTIGSLRVEIIAFVVVVPLIFLSPFVSFLGLMLRTKKQGLLDYGDLIGRHGRLVRERWIDGKQVADAPILDAPELGPIADTAAPYELISKIRPLPLTMGSLIPLVGAAVLPMVVLATMDLPLKTVLKTVLKILV